MIGSTVVVNRNDEKWLRLIEVFKRRGLSQTEAENKAEEE